MTVTTSGRRRTRADTKKDAPQKNATKAELQDELDRSKSIRSNRHQAIVDGIGLACLPVAALATIEQHKLVEGEVGAYTLDLDTINGYARPVADAICDLADEYKVLGHVLDRLTKATPFAALFGLTVAIGAQIAENHRVLPPHLRSVSPGLTDRDTYVANLKAHAAAAAKAEEAERADEAARVARAANGS